MLPMQGPWVQSLAGELRSHMLYSVALQKKKKFSGLEEPKEDRLQPKEEELIWNNGGRERVPEILGRNVNSPKMCNILSYSIELTNEVMTFVIITFTFFFLSIEV